jgi:hypothetical protein
LKKKWTVSLAAVILSTSIVSYGSYAFADEAASGMSNTIQQTAPAVYPLTAELDVEVKSVLNEKVTEGTRIGVVVKMKNNSASIKRVPEYELRAITADGVSYTLQPSTTNAKAVQPLAKTELSYMVVLDRTDEVVLKELNWTEVDWYVYPKQETLAATTPITAAPWTGGDMTITDPSMLRQWTDSFVIPSTESPIIWKPVQLQKQSTPQGSAYVLQLLAYNPAGQSETVPSFRMDGKSDAKVYPGQSVEQNAPVLQANESKYVYYSIPVDPDTELRSLNVLTTEQFAGNAGPTTYQVGRLNIALPAVAVPAVYETYQMGSPMTFDSLSTLIHPDMKVSMQELQVTDNPDEGNKLATAKFQLTNEGNLPLSIPSFQTRLLSSTGEQYTGLRQVSSTTSLVPNSSMTITYAYRLPSTEEGSGLTLEVLDAVTAAPFQTTIASYGAVVQPQGTEAAFSVYPFDVKVGHWDMSFQFSPVTLQYSYKAKFYMDVQRKPNVLVEANAPVLQFELQDQLGRVLATSTKSLTGMNRLVSGENPIAFVGTSEQFDSPLRVKIYEVVQTEGGTFKRQVAEFIK